MNNMQERRCKNPNCTTVFERTPHANNKQFCSDTCRDSYYKQRNKERMNARQREYYHRKNIKGDTITCQICGKDYKQVGSHITQVHKIPAREYRKKYGFDVKRGQLAKDLRERKREAVEAHKDTAIQQNLIDKGSKTRFKKGQAGLGRYTRSKQTMDRLKQQSFIKKTR